MSCDQFAHAKLTAEGSIQSPDWHREILPSSFRSSAPEELSRTSSGCGVGMVVGAAYKLMGIRPNHSVKECVSIGRTVPSVLLGSTAWQEGCEVL